MMRVTLAPEPDTFDARRRAPFVANELRRQDRLREADV